MTFKRTIAAFLIVAMIYLAAPSAYAMEIENAEMDVIIHDEEKIEGLMNCLH